MSKRSVEVELVLKTAQYKTEARSAKDSTEALDRSVEATDRDLKKLPPDAAKAAAAMKLLGAESATANLKLEDGTGKSSTALGKLEQDLVTARAEVHKFADEFNRTGSSDSLAKMFKADDAVKGLKALKSELTTALETGVKDAVPLVENTLTDAAQAGNKTFWQTFSSLPPEAQAGIAAGIAGVVAVAAPAIGGVLTGALLAGVGAAGIGLAIAGQIHDPAVQGALAHLGADFQSMLSKASSPFQPVLLAGLGRLDEMLARIGPSLQLAFARIGPDADKFFRGLTDMVENTLPGFEHGMEAGVRILGELGPDFAQLGTTISTAFDLLTRGADGGASALHYLFAVVDATILSVSAGLSMLAQNFQMLKMAAELASGNFVGFAADMAAANQPGLNLGRTLGYNAAMTAAAADNMSKLAAQISRVRITADTLAASMVDKLFTATMNVDQADIAWHQSLLNLHDTLAQNGLQIDKHTHQISENTKGGLENRQAILSVVSANMQNYQAFVAVGGSATDAARQYDDNTAALERQLRQAGYTQAEIDGLIGKYKSIPDTVNTRIQFEGLQDAIDRLDTLIRRINGLPYSKEVNVTYREHVEVIAGGGGGEGRQRWGGVYEHAQDGALRDAGLYSPMSPARYAFAEPATGGEAFIPKYGDARRSTGILAHAAGWYGMDVVPRGVAHSGGGSSGPVRITMDFSGVGTSDTSRAMAGWVQKAVRTGQITLKDSAGRTITV